MANTGGIQGRRNTMRIALERNLRRQLGDAGYRLSLVMLEAVDDLLYDAVVVRGSCTYANRNHLSELLITTENAVNLTPEIENLYIRRLADMLLEGIRGSDTTTSAEMPTTLNEESVIEAIRLLEKVRMNVPEPTTEVREESKENEELYQPF